MKRNDSGMNLVKEWGSPRSNVQLFVPQEFVATCSTGGRLLGWKAYGSMVINQSFIYHDVNNDEGRYLWTQGETVNPSRQNLPSNATSNHDDNYMDINEYPEPNSLDGDWYLSQRQSLILIWYDYFDPVKPIYECNGSYFTSFERVYSTS